jgi:peptidyl-prolyl cis-trans isomerase SurA
MMQRLVSMLVLAAVGLSGCETDRPQAESDRSNGQGVEFIAPGDSPPAAGRTLAYINGQPVTMGDLQQRLLESSGGQVMAEVIIDRGVEQRLLERSIKPTAEQVAAEYAILGEYLARTINPDRDEVVRLARQLKDRVGPARFDNLLRRNAAMRLLVQDQVNISNAAIEQRFELDYGPRYDTRIIVVASLREAEQAMQALKNGTSFNEVATQKSIHSSAGRGGLLPPISLANEGVPSAIRSALKALEPGQVSQPISMPDGFTLLLLERKIERQDVNLVDVKEQVVTRVRHDTERRLMEQLGRTFLERADVTVLDPALRWSWEARRSELNPAE